MPDRRQRVRGTTGGMALIAPRLGVTAALGYETYEWAVDHWFGQHVFIRETDTVTASATASSARRSPVRSCAVGPGPLHDQAASSALRRELLSLPSTERQPRAAG